MKEFFDLVNGFELRNNLEIQVTFYSDTSGSISKSYGFVEYKIFSFNNLDELFEYLKHGKP